MSFASVFLAFAPAIAARFKPEKSKREAELEAEVERLTFALDYWRDAANAAMNVTRVVGAECERLRLEAGHPLYVVPPQLGPSFGQMTAQQVAAFNQQMQNLQQYNAMQNGFDCTCVPARSRMLRA